MKLSDAQVALLIDAYQQPDLAVDYSGPALTTVTTVRVPRFAGLIKTAGHRTVLTREGTDLVWSWFNGPLPERVSTP